MMRLGEKVIKLSGTEQENSFTIGGTNSDNGWDNRQDNILQLKMKNANLFTITYSWFKLKMGI